jgi:hypothetical protein
LLALSENAVDAIREIIGTYELPEGAGLRIEANVGDWELELTASIELGPIAGDAVVSDQDVLVFLEPDAALYLDDKVLAAEAAEAGRTRFVVHDR